MKFWTHPSGIQILSISCSVWENCMFTPAPEGWCPHLGEILYPPLKVLLWMESSIYVTLRFVRFVYILNKRLQIAIKWDSIHEDTAVSLHTLLAKFPFPGREGYSRVVKTQSAKFWPNFNFWGWGYSRVLSQKSSPKSWPTFSCGVGEGILELL